jgi:hypothetical protein
VGRRPTAGEAVSRARPTAFAPLHRILAALVAGSLMLAALVLGCCDEMTVAPTGAHAGAVAHLVDDAAEAQDHCGDAPAAVGTIPWPPPHVAPVPARAADPAMVGAPPASNVSAAVDVVPVRYQLCVMRT